MCLTTSCTNNQPLQKTILLQRIKSIHVRPKQFVMLNERANNRVQYFLFGMLFHAIFRPSDTASRKQIIFYHKDDRPLIIFYMTYRLYVPFSAAGSYVFLRWNYLVKLRRPHRLKKCSWNIIVSSLILWKYKDFYKH